MTRRPARRDDPAIPAANPQGYNCVTSRLEPTEPLGREVRVLVASRNRGLRERLVDAAHAHPRVHLVATLRDIAEARSSGPYPDVVLVGDGELSLLGASAVTLARELFPGVLLVPVTEGDEPDHIVDLAQRTASGSRPH